jgi:hypothetical protein
MRKVATIVACLAVTTIFATCSKSKRGDSQPDVEQYVKLLKTNKYESTGFPAFTHENIDELLKYRNEKEMITQYPRNPISSFAQGECKLGIIILWTIEAIRTGSINSGSWVGSFPSQNPILKLRDFSEGLVFVVDEEAHQVASNAYYDWWKSRLASSASFNAFMQIDPLKDTKYAWH